MSEENCCQGQRTSYAHRYRHVFLDLIVPLLLLILTLYTTLVIGSLMSENNQEPSASVWIGFPYAISILIIIGTHAFGHYTFARLNGIKVYTPYFIPTFGIIGTMGAYTKIHWPVSDRKALMKIFMAGPIFGFLTACIVIIIGLFFSDVKDNVLMNGGLELGDSIITHIITLAIFGNLPDTKGLILHPVAYAGYIGLFYNFCHLLPIGKLDGGRLVYALWGYRVTKWVSYVSIGILIILGFLMPDETTWKSMAILGVICTIGFKRQYPSDQYNDQPLERLFLILMCIIAAIFIVSFSPTPLIHIIKR